jgi:hypothetical protein
MIEKIEMDEKYDLWNIKGLKTICTDL